MSYRIWVIGSETPRVLLPAGAAARSGPPCRGGLGSRGVFRFGLLGRTAEKRGAIPLPSPSATRTAFAGRTGRPGPKTSVHIAAEALPAGTLRRLDGFACEQMVCRPVADAVSSRGDGRRATPPGCAARRRPNESEDRRLSTHSRLLPRLRRRRSP